MPVPPKSGKKSERRTSTTVLVVAAVVLAGWALWGSWRHTRRAVGEQDFEVTLICPQCGCTLQTSFAKMDSLPPPLATGDEGRRSPITRCPHCSRCNMFRAGACPNCGQPALLDAVTVDGKVLKPRCFSCGWKRE